MNDDGKYSPKITSSYLHKLETGRHKPLRRCQRLLERKEYKGELFLTTFRAVVVREKEKERLKADNS